MIGSILALAVIVAAGLALARILWLIDSWAMPRFQRDPSQPSLQGRVASGGLSIWFGLAILREDESAGGRIYVRASDVAFIHDVRMKARLR